MTFWEQVAVSAGTVITLLLGFWAISHNLKKTTEEAVDNVEKRIGAKFADKEAQDKVERMEAAAAQQQLCSAQCLMVSDLKYVFEEYLKKAIREAEMQFNCHFTTLEALEKIAHKQPINGEIGTQLDLLKTFMIKEGTRIMRGEKYNE